MIRQWRFLLAIPVASAAILAGCTQEVADDLGDDRTAMGNRANRAQQEVSLTGCVATGHGNNQLMLHNVRSVSPSDDGAGATAPGHTNIPENVPIRLAMNDAQVEGLVGYTVSVTGLLSDGRNTIGTTSEPTGPNESESRVDRSQAATNQHHSDKVREEAGPIGTRAMNNGTFPELAVTRIDSTGEKCTANRETGR